MGSRGPTPKSIEELEAAGSWRAAAARKLGEAPRESVKLPECPEWVEQKHRKHWDKIAKHLVEIGIMTESYSTALGLLVSALGQYIEACEEIETHGSLAYTDSGGVYTHPSVHSRTSAMKSLVGLLREFGMTPASRVGLRSGAGAIEVKSETTTGKPNILKLG